MTPILLIEKLMYNKKKSFAEAHTVSKLWRPHEKDFFFNAIYLDYTVKCHSE
jgi:hypothetical protein